MGEETQGQQKKRKKKKQVTVLKNEKAESALMPLLEVLNELEKEEKYVDIQICPKCKSPLVQRVSSMKGDMMAHMGLSPPKYECRECSWRERTVLKATNKPTTIRDVVLMAEAKEAALNNRQKKKRKLKFF
jgi:flagellar biosynthesis component FlhA